jgi:hypothetical protein
MAQRGPRWAAGGDGRDFAHFLRAWLADPANRRHRSMGLVQATAPADGERNVVTTFGRSVSWPAAGQ